MLAVFTLRRKAKTVRMKSVEELTRQVAGSGRNEAYNDPNQGCGAG